MTAPRPPAVMYLAAPGERHPVSPRSAADVVLAELEQLHQRCLAGVGDPLDAGEVLVALTAARRIRYTGGGGGSSAMLDSDLVDALVHGARAGYRLCLKTDPDIANVFGHYCWLPTGHPDGCELRGWWRWSLLYGYRGPVRLLCSRCSLDGPARPAPPDCPHR